jgi:hypothetical protein
MHRARSQPTPHPSVALSACALRRRQERDVLDRNVETLDALFLVSDGLLSSFASTGLGNWQLQTPVPPAPAPRVRRLFCFWCVCVCVCVCVCAEPGAAGRRLSGCSL